MQSVNLIPTRRREARRNRLLVRRWTAACVAYTVVMAVAAMTWRTMWEPALPDRSSDIDRVEIQAGQLSRDIGTRAAQLADLNTKLRHDRDTTQHPEWTVLLAVLSDQLGDRIVLKQCSIQPQDGPAIGRRGGKRSDDPDPSGAKSNHRSLRPRRFIVRLSGVAQSTKEVSHLLLRFEQTGLFSSVKLLSGMRAAHLTTEALAFEVECVLDGQGETGP